MFQTKANQDIRFSELIHQYDAFLLDLWGVVHDGTAMYPGAAECMAQMQRLNKRVVIISNAPRRAAKAEAVLDQLGVSRDLYQAVYTSGEVAYQHIRQGWFDLGQYYFFIGPRRDADVLNGLRQTEVDQLDGAEFLLNVGFGSEQDEAVQVTDLLSRAKDLELPMLCLNPDLVVVKITGQRYECAGVIANQYKAMGGIVHYFGKPYSDIYEMAHHTLGGIDKKQILAIGDGPDTDIRGAIAYGVDSLLIAGGIMKSGERFEFNEENTPRYEMPQWIW